MSIRLIQNNLYIKNKDGKLIPISMFSSGADKTLSEIRKMVAEEQAKMNSMKNELDEDVKIVVNAAEQAENTLGIIQGLADQVSDDEETTRQYVDIVQSKAAFGFVIVDGYYANGLPRVSNPLESVIYMVKNNSNKDNNIYDKWLWYKGSWERIASEVDEDTVNGLIDTKLIDMQAKLNEFETKLNCKANAYAKRNIILSASSWTGSSVPYSATISFTGVNADSDVKILPIEDFTLEQAIQWGSAGIVTGKLANDSITLKAFGEKPTVNIPLCVLYTSYIPGSGVGPGNGSSETPITPPTIDDEYMNNYMSNWIKNNKDAVLTALGITNGDNVYYP